MGEAAAALALGEARVLPPRGSPSRNFGCSGHDDDEDEDDDDDDGDDDGGGLPQFATLQSLTVEEPPIDMGAFDPMRFDSSYVPTVAKDLPPKLMATWMKLFGPQVSQLPTACRLQWLTSPLHYMYMQNIYIIYIYIIYR
jgi:hypothetical protein